MSLFLTMALMSLRLWELVALAVLLLLILALQIIGVALFTTLDIANALVISAFAGILPALR